MALVFPFDPNIARASTIPARLYNDPVYLELERERVFAHSWQLVGRLEQEICEVVQRNLRSRVYDRGRYSAARENGVHHFHSLLHEFLT
jgi:phenylpropionate dioxygenase-like ring-hydroxylating dioxygenase large terminal subunit